LPDIEYISGQPETPVLRGNDRPLQISKLDHRTSA
jgi:hypothetical protein